MTVLATSVALYALTLAAVTLRIYIPLSISLGLDFHAACPVIAWRCWVPNLAATEMLCIRQRDRFLPTVAN